jgi:hypothetical protein
MRSACSSDEKAALLTRLGVDRVVNYKKESLKQYDSCPLSLPGPVHTQCWKLLLAQSEGEGADSRRITHTADCERPVRALTCLASSDTGVNDAQSALAVRCALHATHYDELMVPRSSAGEWLLQTAGSKHQSLRLTCTDVMKLNVGVARHVPGA